MVILKHDLFVLVLTQLFNAEPILRCQVKENQVLGSISGYIVTEYAPDHPSGGEGVLAVFQQFPVLRVVEQEIAQDDYIELVVIVCI